MAEALQKRTVEAEAQEKLKELVALVVEGAEVVLTDDRVQRARLMPLSLPTTARVAGLHLGVAATTPDFDDPLPEDFWASE